MGPMQNTEARAGRPGSRPYFLWDRNLTDDEFREIVRRPDHPEHVSLLALLLREARPDEVWAYVTPAQVAAEWERVAPRLGRHRPFWAWLLDTWRGLGFLP